MEIAVIGGGAKGRQDETRRRRRFGAQTHAVGVAGVGGSAPGNPRVSGSVTRYARRDLMQLPIIKGGDSLVFFEYVLFFLKGLPARPSIPV